MTSQDQPIVCGVPLVVEKHGLCQQKTLSGFPCCWNHIPLWMNSDFRHLQCFVASGIYKPTSDIKKAFVSKGVVHVFVVKAVNQSRKRRKNLDLRIPVATATIAADLFANHGHDSLATWILQAI